MYIYYKIYKINASWAHIRRVKYEKTRDNRQTQVKNCLKWTASGLLIALLFVLVFAGTLSGAFGIESDLQQNGIIENNVASADSTHLHAGSSTGISINPTATTVNINPDVSKKHMHMTMTMRILLLMVTRHGQQVMVVMVVHGL